MSRPLRIEFAGALYHLTSRGDRGEPVFDDDCDRERFLGVLAQVVADFNWICHAYCLMGDHYHLVVETPDGNLSKGMRQLNGVYTQYSNRRHRRAGPLFQGRYKAILVDADEYLLELTRHVVLNPVRVGMVRAPGDWDWSSYRAMVGEVPAPAWLAADGLLAQFGKRRPRARAAYRRFVANGVGGASIWEALRGQIYLGGERFVERMDKKARMANRPVTRRSLARIERECGERDAAMVAAWQSDGYSYAEIAQHFGVHFTTVGRVVRNARRLETG